MYNLLSKNSINRVAPNNAATTTYTLAAGTTDVQSSAVAMGNFVSVAFIIVLGAIVSTGTLGVKLQGSANGTDGWTDISGTEYTATTDSDDDKLILIEESAVLSTYRHVRVAFDRGTANTTIDALIAILSNGSNAPVSHGAMVKTSVIV